MSMWEFGDDENEDETQDAATQDPEIEFFRIAERVWLDQGKGGKWRLNSNRGSARLIRYFGTEKAARDFEEMIFGMRSK